MNLNTLKNTYQIISTIITLATIITMLTPSKADDRFVQYVKDVLNIAAGNIWHNKNFDAPDIPDNVKEYMKTNEFKQAMDNVTGGKK